MTERPCLTPGRRIEPAARDKRLARALRENLHRRKEQARAREPREADDARDNAAGDERPA